MILASGAMNGYDHVPDEEDLMREQMIKEQMMQQKMTEE